MAKKKRTFTFPVRVPYPAAFKKTKVTVLLPTKLKIFSKDIKIKI